MNIFNVLTYTAKVVCVDNVITFDRILMLSHQNFPLNKCKYRLAKIAN